MRKAIFILAITSFLSLGFSAMLFAQESGEAVTLTTYYPSPYGAYNHMEANRMAVGDTNESGGLESGDIPPEDGQLYVKKSVIYKPQSGNPDNWSAGTPGELAYSADKNNFYYYSDNQWLAQGGSGGGSYTAFGTTSCATDWTVAYTGVAMTIMTHYAGVAVVAGGGIVCKAGNAFTQSSSDPLMIFWWTSNPGQRTGDPIPCAVCVK